MKLLFLFLSAVLALLVTAGAAVAGPAEDSAAAQGAEIKPSGPTADDWSAFTPLPMPTTGANDQAAPPKMPAPAPDLSAYLGKTIVRVAAAPDGERGWAGIEPPTITSVRAGAAFDGAKARAALNEALATGRFASGRVEVSPEGGGVALVVRLVPRKLIDRLEVDLHDAEVDQDEVLREAQLASGGEYIASGEAASKQAIKDVFLRHGYPSATVTLVVRATDDPTRVALLLDVVPGPKRVVEKRWFYLYGAAPADVRRLLRSYAVSVGDRADENAFAGADEALETSLQAAGWYKAHVFHDLVLVPYPPPRPDPSRKTITTLRVRVETGPKVVLRFDGADHYDDATLEAAIGAEAETDRSIGHFADKLHDFYVKRGFLDVEITPETKGDGADRVVAFVFHVIEHKRVFVRSRTYPCLNPREIARLNGPGPRSSAAIGSEIDSFLQEELPGADFVKSPDEQALSSLLDGPSASPGGVRAPAIDLDPDHVYVEDTYARAAAHVQELYRNEGYLHALVGPVQVVRAQCRPGTQPNVCIPMPTPPLPTNQCTFDAKNLPAPVDALPATFTCTPNPAAGIRCSPVVDLLIPVKLGPRTRFYDMAFVGAKSIPEKELAEKAALDLGQPVNTLRVEDARKRLIELYRDRGYFWVQIGYSLDYSLDNTNARVRFEITEGELVRVKDIVIRGNRDTNETIIRKRVVLALGQPYSASQVRLTQQFLGSLGVFSSVDIQLEDQYVPAPWKRVIITVVEKMPQHVQPTLGFATGEGFRGGIEYGHTNVFGDAVSLTGRASLSYLPDDLIFDQTVKSNIQNAHLSVFERVARVNTLSIGIPEIGLGPRAWSTFDLSDVQYLERDFTLRRDSLTGTILYNIGPRVRVSLGNSIAENDVTLFTANTIQAYLGANANNPDLQRLLRVPNGQSIAFAQSVSFTWDGQDDAFHPHTGMLVSLTAEVVNATSLESPPPTGSNEQSKLFQSHFIRLSPKIAGHIPLSKNVTLALELRVGHNIHFARGSSSRPELTYPDRLFFLGGPDSMRGWLLDALVPQEYVNLLRNPNSPAAKGFTIADVPIRGGDFMINPKVELRFPIKLPLEGGLFADLGNVWLDPAYLFKRDAQCLNVDFTCGGFELRADVGIGLRVATPVGTLAFDYGINLTREPWDDFGAPNFSIGVF